MRSPLDWLIDWTEKRRTEACIRELRKEKLQWDLDNTINPIPLEEAKQRGEALLTDTSKWQCVKAPVSQASYLEPLAPLLRVFFEQYKSVQAANGHEAMLLRDEIAPAEHPYFPTVSQEFFRIGYDWRLTPFQIWVRPSNETIHLMDLEVSLVPRRSCTTIYHYLLYVDHRAEPCFRGSPARRSQR